VARSLEGHGNMKIVGLWILGPRSGRKEHPPWCSGSGKECVTVSLYTAV